VSEQRRDPQRYRIIGEHGRGGLGRVSRAHDQDLGRDVAIKELIARDPLGEVRFHREALITARLEHPGIVPVYEAGRWPDGTPFYAMKLVAGRPLRQLIVERATVDERIALLHHVIAVADAMAYAHDQRIIHRDLKPANVIVGDFGETIVIDWGLAKDLAAPAEPIAGAASSIQSDDHLTTTGSVMGTPAYMAPEQARGESVDQRADVFAIGAMLWELCSLEKVPPTESHLRHRMLRSAGIDRDLVTIIDKALAAAPEQRYRHAGALAADLKAFKSGARINARSYSLFAMLAHWTRRHRALAVSAIAFVVLLVASAVALAILYRKGLQTRMAQEAAELSVAQAEIEQGRQALLHDDSAEAQVHLTDAYRRGDHSPSVAFMLARAIQARRAEQARFASSAGRVWSVVFSPDGHRIVATDDDAARIWDAQTHQLLFTLAHGDTVYHAVYSADGARIVTACGDGIVRVWDAAAGTLLRKLGRAQHGERSARYYRVAMSPDGRLVAAIDVMGEMADVWDASTGTGLAELRNDGSGTPALAFSADGQWLAASGGDDVRVFDTRTWTRAVTLAGRQIHGLSFDPTGPRLATGSFRGDASLWAIPSGERLQHFREIGEPVDAVAFSPDGELVVTGSRDGAEQIWNAGSGRLQSQINYLHSKILAVEFDAASKLVLAAGSNGTVVVAEAALAMPVAVLDGPRGVVTTAHFDPRSRRVIGSSWDGTARLWDATPPYLRWSSPPVSDFCGIATSPQPDQRFVAVGCEDYATRVWDTAHDQLLAELPRIMHEDSEFLFMYPAVSPTGDRAAIARGNAVEIYALPGGQLVRTVPHAAPVNVVAFADTGHDLVSGGIDGSLVVTRDGHEPLAMPMSTGGIDAATFLPDGRVLAADARLRLRVIDPDRTTVLADVAIPARMMSLRPSPNGRRLIAIPRYNDKTAPPILWDLEHHRLIAQLDSHIGRVFSARFVASGDILSAGGDGTVRRWDATTGRLKQTYRGGSRFLADAVLDPSGSVIVAGDADGLLRFWDASSAKLLWTLPAHKLHVIGLHFEGDDLVTRGFGGDVARWTLPKPEQVIAACDACNAGTVLRE
jgi:WD40 repeat protein